MVDSLRRNALCSAASAAEMRATASPVWTSSQSPGRTVSPRGRHHDEWHPPSGTAQIDERGLVALHAQHRALPPDAHAHIAPQRAEHGFRGGRPIAPRAERHSSQRSRRRAVRSAGRSVLEISSRRHEASTPARAHTERGVGRLDRVEQERAGQPVQRRGQRHRVAEVHHVRAGRPGRHSRWDGGGCGGGSVPGGCEPVRTASTTTARSAPAHRSSRRVGSPSHSASVRPATPRRRSRSTTAGPTPSSRRYGLPTPITTERRDAHARSTVRSRKWVAHEMHGS